MFKHILQRIWLNLMAELEIQKAFANFERVVGQSHVQSLRKSKPLRIWTSSATVLHIILKSCKRVSLLVRKSGVFNEATYE